MMSIYGGGKKRTKMKVVARETAVKTGKTRYVDLADTDSNYGASQFSQCYEIPNMPQHFLHGALPYAANDHLPMNHWVFRWNPGVGTMVFVR